LSRGVSWLAQLPFGLQQGEGMTVMDHGLTDVAFEAYANRPCTSDLVGVQLREQELPHGLAPLPLCFGDMFAAVVDHARDVGSAERDSYGLLAGAGPFFVQRGQKVTKRSAFLVVFFLLKKQLSEVDCAIAEADGMLDSRTNKVPPGLTHQSVI
jgi:hypothetical protein